MAKYANWYKVNLSLGMDNADLADGDVVIVTGICPFPGRIKQVWVGALVLPVWVRWRWRMAAPTC